jgi:hypothetical protein
MVCRVRRSHRPEFVIADESDDIALERALPPNLQTVSEALQPPNPPTPRLEVWCYLEDMGNVRRQIPVKTGQRQMQLRFLAYTAISVPVIVGAFVAGVVFERQRAQTWSQQQPPALASTPDQAGTAPKAEQDPAPYQEAASKAEQDRALQPEQASRQEKITQGMQAIEAAWRVAIYAEHLFAVKTGVCYGARFIRRGADVRADLAQMDGIADPQVGVIRITGMTAANQPTGKQSCFASIAEALAANRRSSESLEPIDATFTYKISNNEIRLNRIASEPAWLAIAINDNLRLQLGSWKDISTQQIDPN